MRLSSFKIWQNKKICSATVCQMRLVFLAGCYQGLPRAYLYTCVSYSVSHPAWRRLPSHARVERSAAPSHARQPGRHISRSVRAMICSWPHPSSSCEEETPARDWFHVVDPPRVSWREGHCSSSRQGTSARRLSARSSSPPS